MKRPASSSPGAASVSKSQVQKKASGEKRLEKETRDKVSNLSSCDVKKHAECWEKQRASLEALVKGWQESKSDLVRTWKSKDIEEQQLRHWIT